MELAEKLVQKSRIKEKTRVVFGVTGSDGIELAVRAARYYTGQPYILTAYGDYHGVTYGTMGLTSKGGMHGFFYPILPDTAIGYFHFPYCYRCWPPFPAPLTWLTRTCKNVEQDYVVWVSWFPRVAACIHGSSLCVPEPVTLMTCGAGTDKMPLKRHRVTLENLCRRFSKSPKSTG